MSFICVPGCDEGSVTVMRMRRVEFQDYQDKVSFNKQHSQQIPRPTRQILQIINHKFGDYHGQVFEEVFCKDLIRSGEDLRGILIEFYYQLKPQLAGSKVSVTWPSSPASPCQKLR